MPLHASKDLVFDLNKAYAKAVPASPASPLPPPPLPPPHPAPASPLSLSLSRAIQKAQEEAAQIFNLAKPTPAVGTDEDPLCDLIPSSDDEEESAQPRAWRAPGPSRNEAGSLQKLQEEAAQIFGTKPAAAAAVVVDDNDVDSEDETGHESDDETEHVVSDEDSDYDPETFVVPAPPSHKRGPKPSKRMLETGRPARSVDDIDPINWKIEVCPTAEGFLQLTEARTGHSYVVPKARVRKAMQMLNPDDVSSCTSEVENRCRCNRKCHEVLRIQTRILPPTVWTCSTRRTSKS